MDPKPTDERSLREHARELFEFALYRASGRRALADLHHQLLQFQEQLQQPMRVAVVGQTKAGKSTLINALLGKAVVATGVVEATCRINWLKYGTPSYLRGRPEITSSFSYNSLRHLPVGNDGGAP